MSDAERDALVERMADAAADAYMDNEWITFTAAMRAAIRAALAVAEPVVREDERERCIEAIAEYEFPLDIAVDHQAMLDMRVGLDLAAHAIRKGAA